MVKASENAQPVRKSWVEPKLERLTVDLTSIAGNQNPFGDNAKFNGKNMPAS
ncbi:hypothetical protein [Altererythrobacter sp.]|uniref:hypothetical protein n=1 Tax=Altererythrobacter sp. TaxID=1872480 RepID=UPI003D00AAA5